MTLTQMLFYNTFVKRRTCLYESCLKTHMKNMDIFGNIETSIINSHWLMLKRDKSLFANFFYFLYDYES